MATLKDAKPFGNRPNQVATELNDGTRVVFRKDFGEQAHTLNRKIFGKNKINHYNIEIQKISTQPGVKDKPIHDFHIVPQKNSNIVVYDKKWRQVSGSGSGNKK